MPLDGVRIQYLMSSGSDSIFAWIADVYINVPVLTIMLTIYVGAEVPFGPLGEGGSRPPKVRLAPPPKASLAPPKEFSGSSEVRL